MRNEYRDPKTGRLISDITSGFKLQAYPYDNCFSNGIYNILLDMADYHQIIGVKKPEKDLNKATDYKAGYGSAYRHRSMRISELIKASEYEALEASTTTLNDLKSCIEDKECSYPLISFSSAYLTAKQSSGVFTVNLPPKLPRLDHVVVLFIADDDEMVFYDPYVARSHETKTTGSPHGRGVVILPTSTTLGYWKKSSAVSWMFWVARKKNASAKKDLYSRIDQY